MPTTTVMAADTGGVNGVALAVLIILFLIVTVAGFMASRFMRADSMESLDEWGLGGRKFGTWITWFLLGGDLYTAYTFVAVPAAMFATGAVAGFFAVPYTIVLYPIIFIFMARLWSVSHRHGYVTTADFVRGRYDDRGLSLAVAVTGFVATMPYIALQLVGIQAVLEVAGIGGGDNWVVKDLPLFVAFVILAAYTYSSGLRAPALIAFVKDILIYIVILVAIVYLPAKFGGWGEIFNDADAKFKATPAATDGILLNANNQLQYATLALGSALALFIYPHSLTGILASRGRNVIKRNMVALPAYSLVLGLLALLGYVAISAGTKPIVNQATGRPDTNTIVPELFGANFPSWFAGIAFAAIGIGALVPAAIMSIAAANLWTRNVYKEYLKKNASPAEEAKQAKLASLVVKFGAVAFIVFIDPQFSIDLQLIGGVIILQTLPAVAIALYTRWFHVWGLVAGWFAGMGYGMYLLYLIPSADKSRMHFGGSALPLSKLSIFGWHPFGASTMTIYVGIIALAVNLIFAVVVTLIAKKAKVFNGTDQTDPSDYHVDEDSPRVKVIAGH